MYTWDELCGKWNRRMCDERHSMISGGLILSIGGDGAEEKDWAGWLRIMIKKRWIMQILVFSRIMYMSWHWTKKVLAWDSTSTQESRIIAVVRMKIVVFRIIQWRWEYILREENRLDYRSTIHKNAIPPLSHQTPSACPSLQHHLKQSPQQPHSTVNTTPPPISLSAPSSRPVSLYPHAFFYLPQ